MKNHLSKISPLNIILIVLVGLATFGLIKYINYRFDVLGMQIENAANLSANIDRALDDKIKNLGTILLSTLSETEQKNSRLKKQFEEITNTVGALEKLSTTDPELLKKYSKVYFLNEHYVPISLSDIDETYRNKSSTNFQFHSDAIDHLEDLFDDAKRDDVSLLVQSAYRSFATQSILKTNYRVTYGVGTANQFSADQGYSEHQLGTALDFTTLKLNGGLEGFDKTPEYQWLLDNAYKYGFILSYPTGNAYYKFEPWHWRFVGVKLATRLHDDSMYFYNMDQRIIDSYLVDIFD